MSLKQMSLGSASSAARGIVMSAIVTGTPLNITLSAGHRLNNGARIAIVGCAADNLINGEWPVDTVSATSANLTGSTGTAALSGTPVIARICDKTPFLPNHSAVALVSVQGATATAAVGTIVIEGADSAVFDNATAASNKFQYTNSSGVATDGLRDCLLSGEIALPAFALGSGAISVEVKLARYMTMRASAWTSGTFLASLLA